MGLKSFPHLSVPIDISAIMYVLFVEKLVHPQVDGQLKCASAEKIVLQKSSEGHCSSLLYGLVSFLPFVRL